MEVNRCNTSRVTFKIGVKHFFLTQQAKVYLHESRHRLSTVCVSLKWVVTNWLQFFVGCLDGCENHALILLTFCHWVLHASWLLACNVLSLAVSEAYLAKSFAKISCKRTFYYCHKKMILCWRQAPAVSLLEWPAPARRDLSHGALQSKRKFSRSANRRWIGEESERKRIWSVFDVEKKWKNVKYFYRQFHGKNHRVFVRKMVCVY